MPDTRQLIRKEAEWAETFRPTASLSQRNRYNAAIAAGKIAEDQQAQERTQQILQSDKGARDFFFRNLAAQEKRMSRMATERFREAEVALKAKESEERMKLMPLKIEAEEARRRAALAAEARTLSQTKLDALRQE